MSWIMVGTAVAGLAGSAISASKASKAQKKAEKEERKKRREMERLKNVYSSLDTSNPYLNMENTMEDLTVNQQQAQFEAQQTQQQQANILDNLRSSAGGSGVAALAQQMAQSGQLQAQRASASIGKQEAMNQRLAAQQAGQIQNLERQGEVLSRQMRRDQVGTMLGMSQSETAAARQQAAMAEQAKWGAISSGVQSFTGTMAAGAETGAFADWGIPGNK